MKNFNLDDCNMIFLHLLKNVLFLPLENRCPGDWRILWINLWNFQELWVRVHPVLPVQRLREARAASPLRTPVQQACLYAEPCSIPPVQVLTAAAPHTHTHTPPHPSKPSLASLHAAVMLDAMQSQGLLNVVCQLYLRFRSVSSLVFSPLLWRECV